MLTVTYFLYFVWYHFVTSNMRYIPTLPNKPTNKNHEHTYQIKLQDNCNTLRYKIQWDYKEKLRN